MLHGSAEVLPGCSLTAAAQHEERIVNRLMGGFDADLSRLIKSTDVDRALT